MGPAQQNWWVNDFLSVIGSFREVFNEEALHFSVRITWVLTYSIIWQQKAETFGYIPL